VAALGFEEGGGQWTNTFSQRCFFGVASVTEMLIAAAVIMQLGMGGV
jgi:hypothetical protein